eukprot:773915-Prymnesium_polylepis.1
MRAYYGVFEAQVEQGTNAETNRLAFDLLAEGTLPHVSIMQPTTRTEEGVPILQFPRLLVGRTTKLPLLLRNEGILPATVNVSTILDAEGGGGVAGSPFSCLACGQSITLDSMAEQAMELTFKPSAAGAFDAQIQLAVLKNTFEDSAILIKAVAYEQQVAFEGLEGLEPQAGAAEASQDDIEDVSFGDIEVGASKSLTFSIRNYSSVCRRFEWPAVGGVSFSPSVGHLLPGATKAITATLQSDEPLTLEGEELEVKLVPITQTDGGAGVDWDDSMVEVKYLTEE